nr:DUF6119 family protein [Streptomyces avermitilis]
MVRGRGRLPCDPGRRTHRPVHPAADDHPPALDQRPTRFQRPRLSRRGLVQPPSGEAGRVPALRQERHRHGEVQGRRPGDLRRSRPREPIDLHQEGTRQHGPPHHLFAQGVVAVETLRSDLEVRTKFLDQVAAHTPDHRLLDDFGTLRVVFGILLKGGQDIRVDSLLAFAQVSLLQAVRRLRAMNAEVEVVAIRR